MKFPGKMGLTQPEEGVQADIVTFLTLEGWRVFAFAKPRSRPRCENCGEIVGHLAGGVPVGWPDLLAIKPRRLRRAGYWEEPDYLLLEVKRRGIKRSPGQVRLHVQLQDIGCAVYTVESVEDVAQALRDLGHALRTGLKSQGGVY